MSNESSQQGTALQARTGKELMDTIRATPPAKLVEIPELESRFIQLLVKTRGLEKNHAEMVFNQERYHFLRQVSSSPSLRECETLSLYGCFMDCAVNGLSFDPSKKLAYIIPSNVNVGTKDQPQWTKRAALEASPYGELAIRMVQKQLRYADNPVVVYEDDIFEPIEENGVKMVNYRLNIKHGAKIVAAFIRLVRSDGTIDYKWFLEPDWKRLEAASAKKNRGTANALYTSNAGQIDVGFLEAKLLKHAFRSMPKVNPFGDFVRIPEDEREEERIPENMYGFAPETNQGMLNQASENAAAPAHTATPVAAQQPRELSDQAKAAILNATSDEEPSGQTRSFSNDEAPDDDF